MSELRYVAHRVGEEPVHAYLAHPERAHNTRREALAEALAYDQAERWSVSAITFDSITVERNLDARDMVDRLKVS